MPGIADLFGAQAPQSLPVINAPQQLQNIDAQQAQNQQRMAETAGATQGIQQKQRGLQLNMLSGILNEPDPDKQRDLAGKIIPIANKLNPSYQIDPNADIGTIRALVQSQVEPTTQATLMNNLARAQMMNTLKAQQVEKDPATGQLEVVDKINGTRRPISGAENEYYSATGQLPGEQGGGEAPSNPTGIFPNMGARSQLPTRMQNGAVPIPAGGGQPLTGDELGKQNQPQEIIGNSLLNNPNALKLAQKNTAEFEKTKQQRQTIIPQIQEQIAALEPDLATAKGGGYENLPLRAGTFLKTDQGLAADRASQLTPGLALALSQLQTTGGGTRAVKAVLQTLLSSKPDVFGNDSTTNISNLNHIKSTVNTYDLETKFLDAYKEAPNNPSHTIDTKADNLFSALLKKYPLESVDKKGIVTYNADNARSFEDEIPLALANPSKYLNAKNEAEGRLQQPQQNNAPTEVNTKLQAATSQQQTPIIKTQADFDKLPSGAAYMELDANGQPTKYRKP